MEIQVVYGELRGFSLTRKTKVGQFWGNFLTPDYERLKENFIAYKKNMLRLNYG